MPNYDNLVSFARPESSDSEQICVSVVINNVLKVNVTSSLWCEYIRNIG